MTTEAPTTDRSRPSHRSDQGSRDRAVRAEIEIEAAPEEVWRALVESEEIARWFSFAAECEPRLGGAVKISWGPSFEGEMKITAFEPARFLEWSEEANPGGWPPQPMAADFHLEGKGGKTILRLVHSGFAESGWDDFLDSISMGWQVYLAQLAHVLERHPRTPRRIVFVEGNFEGSNEAAWERLAGPLGLGLEREGERFTLAMATGDHLAGPIQVWNPPKDLSGAIEGWNDAHLWVEVRMGYAKLTLSTYGLEAEPVAAIEARWSSWMADLFPRRQKA